MEKNCYPHLALELKNAKPIPSGTRFRNLILGASLAVSLCTANSLLAQTVTPAANSTRPKISVPFENRTVTFNGTKVETQNLVVGDTLSVRLPDTFGGGNWSASLENYLPSGTSIGTSLLQVQTPWKIAGPDLITYSSSGVMTSGSLGTSFHFVANAATPIVSGSLGINPVLASNIAVSYVVITESTAVKPITEIRKVWIPVIVKSAVWTDTQAIVRLGESDSGRPVTVKRGDWVYVSLTQSGNLPGYSWSSGIPASANATILFFYSNYLQRLGNPPAGGVIWPASNNYRFMASSVGTTVLTLSYGSGTSAYKLFTVPVTVAE